MLTELPVELFLRIAGYLCEPKDVCALFATCKSLWLQRDDPVLWRTLCRMWNTAGLTSLPQDQSNARQVFRHIVYERRPVQVNQVSRFNVNYWCEVSHVVINRRFVEVHFHVRGNMSLGQLQPAILSCVFQNMTPTDVLPPPTTTTAIVDETVPMERPLQDDDETTDEDPEPEPEPETFFQQMFRHRQLLGTFVRQTPHVFRRDPCFQPIGVVLEIDNGEAEYKGYINYSLDHFKPGGVYWFSYGSNGYSRIALFSLSPEVIRDHRLEHLLRTSRSAGRLSHVLANRQPPHADPLRARNSGVVLS